MYRNFNISEEEKKQILEMHKSHGYNNINEQVWDEKLPVPMQTPNQGQTNAKIQIPPTLMKCSSNNISIGDAMKYRNCTTLIATKSSKYISACMKELHDNPNTSKIALNVIQCVAKSNGIDISGVIKTGQNIIDTGTKAVEAGINTLKDVMTGGRHPMDEKPY